MNSFFQTANPIATSSQPKKILFNCFMYSDGKGDLGHLLDVAKYSPQPYQALYSIVCDEQAKKFVVDSLLSAGILKEIKKLPAGLSLEKYKETHYEEYFKALLIENPDTMIVACARETIPLTLKTSDDSTVNQAKKIALQKLIDKAIQSNQTFQTALQNVCLTVNVSTMPCYRILDEKTSSIGPSIFIGEHDSPGIDYNNLATKVMGFKRHQNGLLIKDALPYEKKAEVLSQLQHPEYLKQLITHCDAKDEKNTLLTSCEQFLKDNLFVPGYFQDKQVTSLFIHSIVSSLEAKQYKHLVFHLDKNFFDEKLINIKQLIKEGISEIEINDNGTIKRQQLITNPTTPKKLKILVGFWLNGHDYQALFQAAQRFAGCSGDKTLELALSNNLIPFYQARKWKAEFAESFAQIAKKYTRNKSVLKYIETFEVVEQIFTSSEDNIKLFSKNIARCFNDIEFVKEWNKILIGIRRDFNLSKSLPNILNQGLNYYKLLDAVKNKLNPAQITVLLKDMNNDNDPEIYISLLNIAIDQKHLDLIHFFYDLIIDSTIESSSIERLDAGIIDTMLAICSSQSISCYAFLVEFNAVKNKDKFFISLKENLMTKVKYLNEVMPEKFYLTLTKFIDTIFNNINIKKISQICDLLQPSPLDAAATLSEQSLRQSNLIFKTFPELKADSSIVTLFFSSDSSDSKTSEPEQAHRHPLFSEFS